MVKTFFSGEADTRKGKTHLNLDNASRSVIGNSTHFTLQKKYSYIAVEEAQIDTSAFNSVITLTKGGTTVYRQISMPTTLVEINAAITSMFIEHLTTPQLSLNSIKLFHYNEDNVLTVDMVTETDITLQFEGGLAFLITPDALSISTVSYTFPKSAFNGEYIDVTLSGINSATAEVDTRSATSRNTSTIIRLFFKHDLAVKRSNPDLIPLHCNAFSVSLRDCFGKPFTIGDTYPHFYVNCILVE